MFSHFTILAKVGSSLFHDPYTLQQSRIEIILLQPKILLITIDFTHQNSYYFEFISTFLTIFHYGTNSWYHHYPRQNLPSPIQMALSSVLSFAQECFEYHSHWTFYPIRLLLYRFQGIYSKITVWYLCSMGSTSWSIQLPKT